MRFENKKEAGKLLALELVKLNPVNPVIVTIPSGGIPIACQIAKALNCDYKLIPVIRLVNKGVSYGSYIDNENYYFEYNHFKTELEEQKFREKHFENFQNRMEEKRNKYQEHLFTGEGSFSDLIFTDDGVATGCTAMAVIKYLRRIKKAKETKIISALPGGSDKAVNRIKNKSDSCIVIADPAEFLSVRMLYREF
jgi:putative phosphoribosyl transferase